MLQRVLFVPVSGPRGMGEFARSLALARALERRWPDARMHFALSREAPYAHDLPYPATLLPSSPTFHTDRVNALIASFQPTLVIFDNAGRSAQIKAAAASGARVVFVSSRRRQRRKAFRLRWMRRLDEHWIAYPDFIAGAPGVLERMKLRMLGRPVVRYLDTVLPPHDPLQAAELMRLYELRPDGYVLIVAGGGSAHKGAENAPQIVAQAAARIAASGCPTVLVGVEAADRPAALRVTSRLPMEALSELIRAAKLVICNGGDTLLQVIACGRPSIAVPIAGDQQHRIDACASRGMTLGTRLDADAIERTATALLQDSRRCQQLIVAARQAGFVDGTEVAVNAIGQWFKDCSREAPPPPAQDLAVRIRR